MSAPAFQHLTLRTIASGYFPDPVYRLTPAAAVRGFTARTLGLLTLVCLLLAAPATAQVNYAISAGTAYVANSFPASGAIVIASTYLGYPVTYIEESAFIGCSGLTSVIIPNSVTGMGDRVFESCPSLTSVTIGNGVPSIGFRAFLACSSLASVTIPNSVTNIGGAAFYLCRSLTNVIIGNSVTYIWTNTMPGASADFVDPEWLNHSNRFYRARSD